MIDREKLLKTFQKAMKGTYWIPDGWTIPFRVEELEDNLYCAMSEQDYGELGIQLYAHVDSLITAGRRRSEELDE